MPYTSKRFRIKLRVPNLHHPANQDVADALDVNIATIDYDNVDDYVNKVLFNMEQNFSIMASHFESSFISDMTHGRDLSSSVESFLVALHEVKYISRLASMFPISNFSHQCPGLRRLSAVDSVLLAAKCEGEYAQLLTQVKDHFLRVAVAGAEAIYNKRKVDATLTAMKLGEEQEDILEKEREAERIIERLEEEIKTLDNDITKTEVRMSSEQNKKSNLQSELILMAEQKKKQAEKVEELKKKKIEIERKIRDQKQQRAWHSFKQGLTQSDLKLEVVHSVRELRTRLETTKSLESYINELQKCLKLKETTAEEDSFLKSFIKRKDLIQTEDELREELESVVDAIYPKQSFSIDMKDGVVECIGRILQVSEVTKKIKSRGYNKSAKEVRLFGGRSIILDEDISSSLFSGINVVLVAPKLEIRPDLESFTIDTSGKDGAPLEKEAADNATLDGCEGADGVDGNDGENAGHVFIKAGEFPNIEKLVIKSMGGSGSVGQTGGKGAKGKKGEVGRDGKVKKPNRLGVCVLTGQRGKEGSDGGRGGDGGNAGAGGIPGLKGDIQVYLRGQRKDGGQEKFTGENGTEGKAGDPGEGGLGGAEGRDGIDHAFYRNCNPFACLRSFKEAKGDLIIDEDDRWHSYSVTVRVRRKENEMQRQCGERGQHGMAATTKKSRQNRAQNRKEPIDVASVLQAEQNVKSQFGASLQNDQNHAERAIAMEEAALAQNEAATQDEASRLSATQNAEASTNEELRRTDARLNKERQTMTELSNSKSEKWKYVGDNQMILQDLGDHRDFVGEAQIENQTWLDDIELDKGKIVEAVKVYQEKSEQRLQRAQAIVRVMNADFGKTKKIDGGGKSQTGGTVFENDAETNARFKSSIISHYFPNFKIQDSFVKEMETFLELWESQYKHMLNADTIESFFVAINTTKNLNQKLNRVKKYMRCELLSDAILCKQLKNGKESPDYKMFEPLPFPPSSKDALPTFLIDLRIDGFEMKKPESYSNIKEMLQDIIQREECLTTQLLAEVYLSVVLRKNVEIAKSIWENELLKMNDGREHHFNLKELVQLTVDFYGDIFAPAMKLLNPGGNTTITTFAKAVAEKFIEYQSQNLEKECGTILSEILVKNTKSDDILNLITKLQTPHKPEEKKGITTKLVGLFFKGSTKVDLDNEHRHQLICNILSCPQLLMNPTQLWEILMLIESNVTLSESEKNKLATLIYLQYESRLKGKISNWEEKIPPKYHSHLAKLQSSLESHYSTLSYQNRIHFYEQFSEIFQVQSATMDNQNQGLVEVESKLKELFCQVNYRLGLPRAGEICAGNFPQNLIPEEDSPKTLKICFALERAKFTDKALGKLANALAATTPSAKNIRSKIWQNYDMVQTVLREKVKKRISSKFETKLDPKEKETLKVEKIKLLDTLEQYIKSGNSFVHPSELYRYVALILHKMEGIKVLHPDKINPENLFKAIKEQVETFLKEPDDGIHKLFGGILKQAQTVVNPEIELKLAKVHQTITHQDTITGVDATITAFLEECLSPERKIDLVAFTQITEDLEYVLMFEVSDDEWHQVEKREGWTLELNSLNEPSAFVTQVSTQIQKLHVFIKQNPQKEFPLNISRILDLIQRRLGQENCTSCEELDEYVSMQLARNEDRGEKAISIFNTVLELSPLEVIPALLESINTDQSNYTNYEVTCNNLLLDYLMKYAALPPTSYTVNSEFSQKLQTLLRNIAFPHEDSVKLDNTLQILAFLVSFTSLKDIATIYDLLEGVKQKQGNIKDGTVQKRVSSLQTELVSKMESLLLDHIGKNDFVLESNLQTILTAARVLIPEQSRVQQYSVPLNSLTEHPTALLENLRNRLKEMITSASGTAFSKISDESVVDKEGLAVFHRMLAEKILLSENIVGDKDKEAFPKESFTLTTIGDSASTRILQKMDAIYAWVEGKKSMNQSIHWSQLPELLANLCLTNEESILIDFAQAFEFPVEFPLLKNLDPIQWLSYIRMGVLQEILLRLIGPKENPELLELIQIARQSPPTPGGMTGLIQMFYRVAILSDNDGNLPQFLSWIGIILKKMERQRNISDTETCLILSSGFTVANISTSNSASTVSGWERVILQTSYLPLQEWTFALNTTYLWESMQNTQKAEKNQGEKIEEREVGVESIPTKIELFQNVIEKLEKNTDMGQLLGMLAEKCEEERSRGGLSKNTEEVVIQILTLLTKIEGIPISRLGSELAQLPVLSWSRVIERKQLEKKYGPSCGRTMAQIKSRFSSNLVNALVKQWEELQFAELEKNTKWVKFEELLTKILNQEWVLDSDVLSKSLSATIPTEFFEHFQKYSENDMASKLRPLTPTELLKSFRSVPINKGIELEDRFLLDKLNKIKLRREELQKDSAGVNSKDGLIAWAKKFMNENNDDSNDRSEDEGSLDGEDRPETGNNLKNEDDLVEVLSHLCIGVYHTRPKEKGKYYPRDIQILAILLFLTDSKSASSRVGRLAQISTGEGKTLIIAMLSIILALRSKVVNVVTSSPLLAEQNVTAEAALFSYFDISVSTNCDKEATSNEAERRKRYAARVMYGDVSTFQGDILLTKFYSKRITAGRVPDVLIVDEVDSMLLDKGENTLYLSHPIPELGTLAVIFVEIWQAVNAADVSSGSERDVALVCKFIRDRMHKGVLKVPTALKEFVGHRLPLWVRSAYTAKHLDPNDPYIISNPENKGEQIIIMDKDTGVEQLSTEWSNGLMQFIQLKHTAKLTAETLKSVFMSNVTYFKSFYKPGSFFGLSGTLGSDPERELLAQVYGLEVFVVPRYMSRRCIVKEGSILHDETAWLNEIVAKTTAVIEDQAVLIICENVGKVEKIVKSFPKGNSFTGKIHTYKSYFDENLHDIKLKAGDVVVSTNLAGRGTDLQLDSDFQKNKNGSLHVILTFMPTNARVEEQAFGRTARAGQKGTTQFVILSQGGNIDTTTIDEIRTERDLQELQRIEEIRTKTIPKIKMEETLFKQFEVLHTKVETHFKSDGYKKYLPSFMSFSGIDNLQLKFLSNRWAIWLDGIGESINRLHLTGETHILESYKKFETEMNALMESAGIFKFAKMSTELVLLGKEYESGGERGLAISCFEEAIFLDPDHAEVAHYYKAACLLAQQGRGRTTRFQAVQHLKKAETLLKVRIGDLMSSSEIVKHVTDQRATKLGAARSPNKFQSQVENKCKVLYVHLYAIEEAIGSILDVETVSNFPSIDGATGKEEAKEVFDYLRQDSEFVTNYKVTPGVSVAEDKLFLNGVEIQFTPKLVIYRDHILKRVQDLLAEKSSVELNSFTKDLETQLSYWNDLLKANIILENGTEMEAYFKVANFQESELTEGMKEIETLLKNEGELKILKEFLQENKGQEFDMDLLSSELSKCTPEVLERLSNVLQKNNKLLTKCNRRVGELAADIKKKIAWGTTKKLYDWPESPQIVNGKYSTSFQFLIQKESEDDQTTDSAPGIKEELKSNHLPLFEDSEEGSRHIWAFLKSSGVVADCTVDFTEDHSKDSESIKKRLETIHNKLKKSTMLKNIFDKYHPDAGFGLSDIGLNPGQLLGIAQEVTSAPFGQGKYDTAREAYINGLNNSLVFTIGTLRTLDNVSLGYKEMVDAFRNQILPDEEVREQEERGFSQIISFTEKKSWWNWGAVVVALLGVLQVLAGVALMYCTFGLSSFLSAALIGEGLSDILFAVEATLNGSFSWKQYRTHKAISLAITLTTAGIGAYFARGTQAASMVGRGFLTVLRTTGKVIGKRLLEYATSIISSHVVEKVLTFLRELILDTFQTLLRACLKGGERLSAAIDALFSSSTNVGQAETVLTTVNEEMSANFDSGFLSSFQNFAMNFASNLGSHLRTCVDQLDSTGRGLTSTGSAGKGCNFIQQAVRIKQWANKIFSLIKWTNYLNPSTLREITDLYFTFLDKFADKIERKAGLLKKQREASNATDTASRSTDQAEQFKTLKEHTLGSTKDHVLNVMATKLQHGLIQPHLTSLLSRRIQSLGAAAVKSCTNYFKSQSNLVTFPGVISSQLNPEFGIHEDELISVGGGDSITVQQCREILGDAATFTRAKDGAIVVTPPSGEQFLADIQNGKSTKGGLLHLMIFANKENRPVEMVDSDGRIHTIYPKGSVSKGTPIRIYYEDGHYMPMVKEGSGDWVPHPVDGNPALDGNCLWQSVIFATTYAGNGQNAEAATSVAQNPKSLSNCKQGFVDYAKNSKTFKHLFEGGIALIGSQYYGGLKKEPAQPSFMRNIPPTAYNLLKRSMRREDVLEGGEVGRIVEEVVEKVNPTSGMEQSKQQILTFKDGPIDFVFMRETPDGVKRLEGIHFTVTSDDRNKEGYNQFTDASLKEMGFTSELISDIQKFGLIRSHGLQSSLDGPVVGYNMVLETAAMNANRGFTLGVEGRVKHFTAEGLQRKWVYGGEGRRAEVYHSYHYRDRKTKEVLSHSYHVRFYDEFNHLRREDTIQDTMINNRIAFSKNPTVPNPERLERFRFREPKFEHFAKNPTTASKDVIMPGDIFKNRNTTRFKTTEKKPRK